MQLVPMVLELIPEQVPVHATVDDTQAYRNGAHIWGAGMHYDALRSNYGRGTTRVVSLAFGHSWVIVSLLVPPPWSTSRLLAVPVLLRLYRSKNTCPPAEYRTRRELAAEMVEQLCRWLPCHRRLFVLGDDEYATRIVAARIELLRTEADCDNARRSLPEQIELCGPMSMDAAFYAAPPPDDGRGRPRKKGARLPSPHKLADSSTPWETKLVHIYGRELELHTKTQAGLWYQVTRSRLVRRVVTRDPKGRIADRAYFTTESTMPVEQIIVTYSHRWSQEVLHRDLKQYFGFHDPQNGWWRHPSGQRRDDRRPGPAAHHSRGQNAATRTVPFMLVIFASVQIWYLTHGQPQLDVARARQRAPWNVRKSDPSFADMLAAARREILLPRFFQAPASTTGCVEIDLDLVELLLAA